MEIGVRNGLKKLVVIWNFKVRLLIIWLVRRILLLVIGGVKIICGIRRWFIFYWR